LGISANCGEKFGFEESRIRKGFLGNYILWVKTTKSCGHVFPSDEKIRL